MSTQDELLPTEERLRELLVGRKIVDVDIVEGIPEDAWGLAPTGVVVLDDGTVLELWGHDGGCGCNSGCYELTELGGIDNVITAVELQENPDSDDFSFDDETERGFYRIVVYSENQQVKLAEFNGTDGNGYYGTGWYLRVRKTK